MGDFLQEAHETMLVALASARQAQAILKRDCERLKTELADLETQLAQLSEFVRLGENLLGTLDVDDPLPGVVDETEVEAALPLLPPPPTAAEIAQHCLEAHGQPLTLEGIYAYAREHGLLHGTTTKEAMRVAMRSRTTLFVRVERGRYGLVAWGEKGPSYVHYPPRG
jgi:HB1, ASXL, restriction endonuclease HTH domain